MYLLEAISKDILLLCLIETLVKKNKRYFFLVFPGVTPYGACSEGHCQPQTYTPLFQLPIVLQILHQAPVTSMQAHKESRGIPLSTTGIIKLQNILMFQVFPDFDLAYKQLPWTHVGKYLDHNGVPVPAASKDVGEETNPNLFILVIFIPEKGKLVFKVEYICETWYKPSDSPTREFRHNTHTEQDEQEGS